MSRPCTQLIAVDGFSGEAVAAAAKELASEKEPRRTAISSWDASGIFGEVSVAEIGAGRPSARTLLLLYAADLAFRLRWEIKPALAEGRRVVVAPYLDTAIAFGRAAHVDPAWIAAMFSFAPSPGKRTYVDAEIARPSDRKGFVEFSGQQMFGAHAHTERNELIESAARHLRALALENK